MVDVNAAMLVPPVGRDATGLPLHGTMAARPGWVVRSVETGPGHAMVTTTYDAAADLAQMACFAFPHELAVTHRLSATADQCELRTTITVTATGHVSVPLCLGWHPYLALPTSPRSSWRLEMPELVHLGVGGDMLPTGATVRQEPEHAPLGDREFDDGYRFVDSTDDPEADGGVDGRTLAISDDHMRVAMEAGPGFTHVQVYAPGDCDVVALEPMAAATNALVTADHGWVHPAQSAALWFALRVGPSGPGA
jgi:aldose 1-epimerase